MSRTAKFDRVFLEEMSTDELGKCMKKVDTAIIPVGMVEPHGKHLPTGTDNFIGIVLAQRIAKAYGKALVLPIISYGYWEGWDRAKFKGNISVSPDVLGAFCFEVGKSCVKEGFRKIVFVNSHGGNPPILTLAADRIYFETGVPVAVVTVFNIAAKSTAEVREQPLGWGVHACEIETSLAMACFPEVARSDLIRMEKAEKVVPKWPSEFYSWEMGGPLSESGSTAYITFHTTREITEHGNLGDPSLARRDKGRKIIEETVKNAVQVIKDMDSIVAGKFTLRKGKPIT